MLRLARNPDEPAGKVKDAHRLAHLQDENLAVVPDRKSLQDQRHSFSCNHEEPLDLRVGYRQWFMIAKLLLENGYYAAARPEHVSESHGHAAHPIRRA